MNKIYVLDRIEDGVATVVCDEGGSFNVSPESLYSISVGDVFMAEFDGKKFSNITPMPNETQRRREYSRSMLARFKNKKTKN